MTEWTRRMAIGFMLGSATFAATSAVPAGAESGVGVVAQYKPSAARFRITRADSEPVPVRIGTVVNAGDRLALPAGAAVVVQHSNGQQQEFRGPGNFEVADAAPLGKLAAIFRSMSHVFDDEYRMVGTAASRGGEGCHGDSGQKSSIIVPILTGRPAIAAGKRDLPLVWVGGCPPFTVSLQATDGTTLYRESVQARQARLDKVALAVGQYAVAIVDATGFVFSGPVDVVDSAPDLPVDIAGDESPLGIIAGAVWLAQLDGGRWRFESFERLRPLIRAGDPLAGAIGDAVLWGHSGMQSR